MEMLLGMLVVAAGGLTIGSAIWPMKLMRKFQFEHWWFIAMLAGLVILPWSITLIAFPHALQAYADLSPWLLIRSNLFAVSWGIANVLFGLCVVRIGVALTTAILTGLGASVAVVIPLIFKGTGLFQDSPGITSPAGLTVMMGVGVMLFGVILVSLAGFGRDKQLKKRDESLGNAESTKGNFLLGLIMAIIAGVTSAGMALSFVYCQGPIVARVSLIQPDQQVKIVVADHPNLTGDFQVSPDGKLALPEMEPIEVGGMSAKATADKIASVLGLAQQSNANKALVMVETNSILAVFAVWSVALIGGALVNLLYPVYLMTKNKSWGVLTSSWKEFFLALIIGAQFCLAVALGGKGMVLLGVLGASVGAGIQQAMQMISAQGLGFISGEWHGIHGKPRQQMYIAIGILIFATAVMAFGNQLAN